MYREADSQTHDPGAGWQRSLNRTWTDQFVFVRMSSVASQQQNQENPAVPFSTSLKPSQNAVVAPWLATERMSQAAATR